MYFSPTPIENRKGRKLYFKQRLVAWVIFLLVWGVIFISNRKMTLGTEKGETSNNALTIYLIQSNHCVKRSSDYSRIWDFFEKRISYVYPQLCVSGTFKRSLNWRNHGTLPPEIPLAIAKGIGDLLYILI